MLILALDAMSSDLFAVLTVAAFVVGVVALVSSRGRDLTAWAVTVLAFAVAWNAVAAT